MKEITSTITNVTVFTDRAQIYRVAQLEAEKGEQIIRFINLPASVEKRSIQVNGKGNAMLKNIKFKEIFHEEITDENKQKLYKDIEIVKLKISELTGNIENIQKEKNFIESIAEKIVEPQSKSKQELNPEILIKILDFYRTNLEQTDKKLRETNILLDKENKLLNKISQELQQAGNSARISNVVDVTIFAEEKCEVKLYLSYIVYGASWSPSYNARVSSEEKKLLLEYNSVITQNTGENWENVGLKLSTAQVQIGGNLPVINPWYVNIYRYVQAAPSISNYDKKRSLSMKEKSKDDFSAFDEQEEGNLFAKGAPMGKPVVTVEENATSSVFIPQGKFTVMSDNLEYSAGIFQEEMISEFDYTTVPKLSQYAYLKAKTKNTTEFPLLPGPINVFFNNNFVAETSIKLVLPTEEFILSLGVDESIKIEHKILSKFNKNEGIFTKKNIKVYEYETQITNTKKTIEKITMSDNIPLSQDEKIKVTLISPKIKENTDELNLSETGILTRILELKPDTKNKFDLKFEIEFPKEETVTGL